MSVFYDENVRSPATGYTLCRMLMSAAQGDTEGLLRQIINEGDVPSVFLWAEQTDDYPRYYYGRVGNRAFFFMGGVATLRHALRLSNGYLAPNLASNLPDSNTQVDLIASSVEAAMNAKI